MRNIQDFTGFINESKRGYKVGDSVTMKANVQGMDVESVDDVDIPTGSTVEIVELPGQILHYVVRFGDLEVSIDAVDFEKSAEA